MLASTSGCPRYNGQVLYNLRIAVLIHLLSLSQQEKHELQEVGLRRQELCNFSLVTGKLIFQGVSDMGIP